MAAFDWAAAGPSAEESAAMAHAAAIDQACLRPMMQLSAS